MFMPGVDYTPWETVLVPSSVQFQMVVAPPKPFLSLRPNPFNAGLQLQFVTPEDGKAFKLQIFDVSGRMVRQWGSLDFSPGVQSFTWDGRDHQGRSLPSGLYFVRYQAGEVRRTSKVVRISN